MPQCGTRNTASINGFGMEPGDLREQLAALVKAVEHLVPEVRNTVGAVGAGQPGHSKAAGARQRAPGAGWRACVFP